MAEFLEERIYELVRYGSSFTDVYRVNISETDSDQEYRSLDHPFPRRKFEISYMLEQADAWLKVVNLYHRAHGKYAGFRARCLDEYTTNGLTTAPTAFDHPLALISAGVYQLQKRYGIDKTAGTSGYPVRTIFKPVSGTVRVGIGSVEIPSGRWSVDTTTGRVTFIANVTGAVTAITKATQAVVTIGTHTLPIGASVHFSSVGGMTQINGLRGLITAVTGTTITVNINSTAFSTYTSGGAVNTNPQSGEIVYGGCEFDFPVRFNTDIPISQEYPTERILDSIELIELLNP